MSMGMNTALKNGQILDNAYGVLGHRVHGGRPGARLPRRSRSARGPQAAREAIRRHVAHLDVDRPLFNDHNAMKALVQSGEILEAVERAVGTLG